MPFTLVGSGIGSNNGSGATLAIVTPVASVLPGDVVFASASCSGILGISGISDGTTALTPLPTPELHTSNNGTSWRGFYLLASIASGSLTYTVTFTGTPTSRSIAVFVFRPSGVAALDVSVGQETIATTAGDSGAGTTTGADELAFGSQANENQSGSSLELINGVSRVAVIDSGTGHTLWYTLPNAIFTNGHATETIGTSTRTLTGLATFSIASAAGASVFGMRNGAHRFAPFKPGSQRSR